MMTKMSFPPSVDEILEEFSEMEDWEERYEYLIELGRELPRLEAGLMCEANLVHGCMSTVWLDALSVSLETNTYASFGIVLALFGCNGSSSCANLF